MTKPVIVTRAGKGDTLSWAEADANFTNLQNATIGVTDGTTSGTLDLNDTLTFTAGTNVTLSYNATTKALTINSSAGASTPTQVDFTATPASTDVYFAMTSATGAGAKDLYAPATGGLKYNTGSGIVTTDVNFTLNGSNLMVKTQGNVRLYDLDDSHSVILSAPSNLTANVNMIFPTSNGSNGQYLQTDGSGNLTWATVSGGATNLDGLSDVVITTPATNNVLRYDGTNWVNTAASTLSVSSATTATTATGATNISISTTNGNANDGTLYPVLVAANSTGNQLPHIDGGALSYNASTDTLNIGTNSSVSGKILLESSGGGSVTMQAGATGTSTTFTFPVTTGTTQQLLTTNGSGQASWTSSLTGGFTFNSNTANTQKLTIGPASLSSTAWTTNGVGLRIQAAQYTDTSSTGTVANSHVHAIGASILASSNTITVTDAGSLYIAGPPTAGTNTTITNGWALLANGRIKATAIDATPIGSTTTSTGAFTTLSASSTVSGTGFSNYLASPPAIGGTAAAAITGTTITATTQFSGPHNGTVGATTPTTGTFTTLTVNGANELRLADTDSSNYVGFKSPATVSTNRIWTLPSADGTNGQVLSTDGAGTLSWATAGGGSSGPTFALIYLSTSDFEVSSTASNANLFGVATLVEDYDANNLVSINGDNDIIIASAGTYLYEILSIPLYSYNYGPGSASLALTSATAYFNIYNITTATQIAQQDMNSARHPGNSSSITYRANLGMLQIRTKIVTSSANNVIRVRVTGQAASSGGSNMSFSGPRPITIKITKVA